MNTRLMSPGRITTLLTATAALALPLVLAPGNARAAYPDEILADHPLGYWRLGEKGPAPEIPAVHNLGSAGADADGAYTNFVQTAQPGALAAGGNTAAKFSSSYVNIPWTEATNPNGPFTIEAWINTDALITDYFSPLSSINFSDASRAGWQIYQTPTNQWEFRVGNDQAAAYVATATGGTVTPGAWTHLAAVYDGANIILYIDGVAVSTKALTGPFSPNTGTPLGIAARILPTGVDRYLSSTMDEVAVYPSALSAAVIASHTANAKSAAPAQPYQQLVLASSPTGYWRLGEGPLYRTAANGGSLAAAGTGYYIGDPTVEATGVVPGGTDTAVTFDGVDDKIDIPWQTELNPAGPFTVEIWAKSLAGTAHRSPLSSRDDTPATNTAGYIIYLTPDNVWSFWSGAGTGNGWPAVNGPPLIEDAWTHLVGIYDGKKIRFIVNGVQAGSTSVPLFQRNSARPLRIGGGATEGTGSFFWQGELDEAAVYNGVLDSARIVNHFTTLKGAPEAVAPTITGEPTAPAAITYVGSTVTLSADVSGSLPLAFQWRKNGSNVSGATTHTLTLANGAETDNGSYTVTVTNGAGKADSQAAEVSFIPSQLPVIDLPPADVSTIAGLKATFAVQASGALVLTYKWQKNNVDIPGATSSTYIIDGVTNADLGTYRVIVTSGAGSTTSSGAVLTLKPGPTDAYAQTVLADKPIAWWRLEESTAVTAEDIAGGHNGDFFNEPLTGSAGIPGFAAGKAVAFDGTSSQKIDVPWTPVLNGTTFSVECWAWVAGGEGSYRSPITSRDDGPQRGYIIYAGAENTWQFWTGTGTGWSTIAGPAVVTGEWAHLVATVTGNTRQFYVNGVLAGTVSSALSLNMARPLRIGGGSTEGDGNFFFNGTIDEVAYYDSVLSAARVTAHYTSGLGSVPGTPPVITITRGTGSNVTVTWDRGTLETSTDLQTWIIPNGASSPLTEAVSGRKYYRVRY